MVRLVVSTHCTADHCLFFLDLDRSAADGAARLGPDVGEGFVDVVVVLFEPWSFDWSQTDILVGHILLIVAAITNAATAVHIRAHRWAVTPLEAIPWQLLGAGIILVVMALVVDGPPVIDWTPQLTWVVLYQGVLATGVAFWAQIVILRNLAAVSTNLTLMAVPVVGVISSALLLGEDITTSLTLGLILVIVGVALNLLSDRGATPETLPTEVG